MKWGLTVRRNGVIKEYEMSGEGLGELLKMIRSILTEITGKYVDVEIDVYEGG